MDKKFRSWLNRKTGQRCVSALKKHGFDSHFVEDIKAAQHLVLDLVKDHDTFGFGGSDTTRKLGVLEKLNALGKTIYDHWKPGISKEEDRKIRIGQLNCDCFFCSANAISETGEIVNVDGIGNRTGAMCFGPKKVVIVAGINKVTPNLDSAIKRIREIAAPMRAKSLDMNTPCAQTGVCNDCNAPQRVCRITTIVHRKPGLTDISVVLINQNIGF